MTDNRTLGVADKVNGLFGQMPASLLGNLLGALQVVAILFGVAPGERLLGFVAAFSAVWLTRLWLLWRFNRAEEPNRTPALSRRWLAWWNTLALASGVVWGATTWAFYPEADAVTRVILIITVYSFCVGAIPVLATQPRVFLGFAAACFFPLIACVAAYDASGDQRVSLILALVFIVMASLGHRFGKVFDKLVWLKARAEQLGEELAAQKATAQAALADSRRMQQERADLLATLDRDMRQPLDRVLSLALQLRLQGHEGSAQELARAIQSSVGALETVAGHLKALSDDHSDADPVHRAELDVGSLWDLLRLDHEPRAYDQRISLAFHGQRHRIFADPLWLDRMLRALLDCALHATRQGGIIVAARPLGDEVRLQVWDTGEPPAALELGSTPGQDLATALAAVDPYIRMRVAAVARQAERLGLRWHLCAVPGQGTRFELLVPRLAAGEAAPRPERSLREAERLRGLNLVVVDDDAAARAVLGDTLGGWQAKVLPLSASAVLAQPQRVAPTAALALIGISEGDEDRLPLIVSAVRQGAGDQLPVIVVAPEASPALAAQALAARFHVLTRPLKPEALWSLLHFKLQLPWADRDPTFAQRLAADAPFWTRAVGTPTPQPHRLQRIAHRGHLFQPASAPASDYAHSRTAQRAHVVMVHGGLSSVHACMGGLLAEEAGRRAAWGGLPLLDGLCVWRFEHDSFMAIEHNVRALVHHVEQTICARPRLITGEPLRIALVGHSRGGIVARLAAAELQRRWPEARWRVYTFGAPHGGTGVFRRIGERWSRVSALLDTWHGAIDGVAQREFVNQLEIVARAFHYDIPAGFRDVEPGRIDRLLASAPPFEAVTAWGSRWVPGTQRAAPLDLLAQLVEHVSGFEPDSDGLVSAASAIGQLAERFDASPLFHTDYFSDAAAMAQLDDCLRRFFGLPKQEQRAPALQLVGRLAA